MTMVIKTLSNFPTPPSAIVKFPFGISPIEQIISFNLANS